MMLSLPQRLRLSAEGSPEARHIELLESVLREIRTEILLPSVMSHQRMAERIERLLSGERSS